MVKTIPLVFVIDDDLSVRKGLERLLSSAGYHVATFGSALEFLQKAPDCPGPACMVLDVKMPGLNGLDLQDQLQRREYVMPIVFITAHGDIPMSVKAMKTGAIDFLTKPFDDEDLLQAIREALTKDTAIRNAMDEKQSITQRIQLLTPREYEILTYAITGMLNKQIAYALDISEKTVKIHRGRLMAKLGIDSVAELVRMAQKAGVKPAQVTDL